MTIPPVVVGCPPELRRPAPAWFRGRWAAQHPASDMRSPVSTVVANHGAGSVNIVRVPDAVVDYLADPSRAVCGDARVSAPGRHDPSHRGDSSQFLRAGGEPFRAPWQWRAAWQAFPCEVIAPGVVDVLWPFAGNRGAVDRQIGNAAPPRLVEALAGELR